MLDVTRYILDGAFAVGGSRVIEAFFWSASKREVAEIHSVLGAERLSAPTLSRGAQVRFRELEELAAIREAELNASRSRR